jgi:hypothetical protein
VVTHIEGVEMGGNVERKVEMINAYTILVGKLERKTLLREIRVDGRNNIKTDHKEMECVLNGRWLYHRDRFFQSRSCISSTPDVAVIPPRLCVLDSGGIFSAPDIMAAPA